MKKILYSALAVACAIGGVAATKASAAKFVSNTFHYKLTLASGQPTGTQLTTTANWSTVPANFSCLGSSYVCITTPPSTANITTKAQLAAAIRANAKVIPASYSVTKQAYN